MADSVKTVSSCVGNAVTTVNMRFQSYFMDMKCRPVSHKKPDKKLLSLSKSANSEQNIFSVHSSFSAGNASKPLARRYVSHRLFESRNRRRNAYARRCRSPSEIRSLRMSAFSIVMMKAML
jgi:hypothetical protein